MNREFVTEKLYELQDAIDETWESLTDEVDNLIWAADRANAHRDVYFHISSDIADMVDELDLKLKDIGFVEIGVDSAWFINDIVSAIKYLATMYEQECYDDDDDDDDDEDDDDDDDDTAKLHDEKVDEINQMLDDYREFLDDVTLLINIIVGEEDDSVTESNDDVLNLMKRCYRSLVEKDMTREEIKSNLEKEIAEKEQLNNNAHYIMGLFMRMQDVIDALEELEELEAELEKEPDFD